MYQMQVFQQQGVIRFENVPQQLNAVWDRWSSKVFTKISPLLTWWLILHWELDKYGLINNVIRTATRFLAHSHHISRRVIVCMYISNLIVLLSSGGITREKESARQSEEESSKVTLSNFNKPERKRPNVCIPSTSWMESNTSNIFLSWVSQLSN